MQWILSFLLAYSLKMALWFRYRIEIKGLDKLNPKNLNKPGGVLFLPTHPTVFVDATYVNIALWPKFPLRPLIVEYMYELPVVNTIMRFLNALAIPSFVETSNSLKRKKSEKVIGEIVKGLRNGQNFLIFPAGHLKKSAYEAVDGASAVHRIIQETPEANVVLVRVKGLWGSSFSRALTGQTPPIFSTIFRGMGYVFSNLLFFTPRRRVIIEFEPAPADFPYHAGRMELNRYLEKWYNTPDGLTAQKGESPGDSLMLVSYSMWKEVVPEIWKAAESKDAHLKIESIPKDIQTKVIAKIADLLNVDKSSIKPNMTLTTDLGMDSLDVAEIGVFLQDQYDVTNVSPTELTTVIKVMALASKQIQSEGLKEEELGNISLWKKPIQKYRAHLAQGQSIPEVFLNNCQRMGNAVACADMRTGVLTYPKLKLRTLILANYIQKLPGKYVGILLPASVTASMAILACQLAGKVPLMINWTVGARHLQAVSQLSKVQVVLSSWAFTDRLQNVDFNGIEDQIVMLEDVRRKIGIVDKLKAWLLAKKGPQAILKAFGSDKLNPDSEAALLFTSGTESMPKGVPLTHQNILSNQKAALEAIEIFSTDVVFGILPPFHSFGFTISSLTGLLAGVRVAFSPDPTDGKRLAEAFARWGITIMCAAPTFVKGMLKAAEPKQLSTLRLCITGAEKMPPDLVQAMEVLKLSHALYEGYGITECSPVLTFNPIGQPRKGVGQPLNNVELCVVDLNNHTPLVTGKSGLILARGPNVFKGYINPGLASPFLEVNGKSWYVTGDLGYLDAEGNLHLSGRLKRFIKIGAEMVSLAAIEEALSHAALKYAWASHQDEGPILAISGKEIPGERPKMTLFTKFPLSVEEANKALREAGFSNLVKVTHVVRLDEIPIMGTGKVNYRKLDEMEAPEQQTNTLVYQKEL